MLEKSPIDVCKQKVKEAKPVLSELGFGYAEVKTIILHHHAKYNTAEGGDLIKAVWQNRKADYDLTQIIESIATGKLKIKKSKV